MDGNEVKIMCIWLKTVKIFKFQQLLCGVLMATEASTMAGHAFDFLGELVPE